MEKQRSTSIMQDKKRKRDEHHEEPSVGASDPKGPREKLAPIVDYFAKVIMTTIAGYFRY